MIEDVYAQLRPEMLNRYSGIMDMSEVEDIFHQVFVSLLAHQTTVRDPERYVRWLMSCRIKDYFRNRKAPLLPKPPIPEQPLFLMWLPERFQLLAEGLSLGMTHKDLRKALGLSIWQYQVDLRQFREIMEGQEHVQESK